MSNLENQAVVQDEVTECPTIVNETVCVQAQVTITPHVETGEIKSFCKDQPHIGECAGTTSPTGTCVFTVSQSICVEVPLTFSATASAMPTGIVCGTPEVGHCPSSTNCTRTVGFYKTHPEVVSALIGAGSIVLGIDAQGASYTVTAAKAQAVLDLNTPSPPAPSSPPLANQYQNLYAQLLAAQLNILNGAVCEDVLQAIAAANNFIATSVSGVGKPGAPGFQEPLEIFNAGANPNCPGHCIS